MLFKSCKMLGMFSTNNDCGLSICGFGTYDTWIDSNCATIWFCNDEYNCCCWNLVKVCGLHDELCVNRSDDGDCEEMLGNDKCDATDDDKLLDCDESNGNNDAVIGATCGSTSIGSPTLVVVLYNVELC